MCIRDRAFHFREPDEFHQPPCGFVGDADVPDFAFFNEFPQYRQRFPDRNVRAFVFGVEYGFSEERDVAAGPVQLVKVDIVRFQASETAFDRETDIGFVQVVLAVAQPWNEA